MAATTITLANGARVTVKGDAADVGGALKRRRMMEDDGFRSFFTTDGEAVTVNTAGVLMVEAAQEKKRGTFGFARALEAV